MWTLCWVCFTPKFYWYPKSTALAVVVVVVVFFFLASPCTISISDCPKYDLEWSVRLVSFYKLYYAWIPYRAWTCVDSKAEQSINCFLFLPKHGSRSSCFGIFCLLSLMHLLHIHLCINWALSCDGLLKLILEVNDASIWQIQQAQKSSITESLLGHSFHRGFVEGFFLLAACWK